MTEKTAIVAGDGIVGLASAHRLLRAGVRTTLIGPSLAAASSSWGNAGHLAVEQVEPLASRKAMLRAVRQLFTGSGPIRTPIGETAQWLPFFLRLAAASSDARFRTGTAALDACMQRATAAWRELLAEIGEPDLLVECGHFAVWESGRSAVRGKQHWRSAKTGPATVRDATKEELERLRELIRVDIHGAIRFEGTGQFTDPGALLDGLEASIASAGVHRVSGTVTRIECDDRDGARVRTADGAVHEADAVVVAAGVASGALLAPTGLTVPIIAERGYHIQAPASRWPDGMPPVVFEDRSLIVTNFTSALRASGFVEFARADRPPDASRWDVLQKHVDELGLPFGSPVARWMGPRPTFPDYLPAIGRSPSVRNLYYAFGHQHLGLTMAAVTAEIVRDLVMGETPGIDLRPFDLVRFGKAASPGA